MKKIVSFIVFLCVIFVTFSKVLAATYYVPDNFSTIQQAVSGVSSGDIIIVRDDTYYENVFISTGQIILQSENGPENCIIDAQGSGHTVRINADQVKIEGFTIKNSGADNVCIFAFDKDDLNIKDNIVSECKNWGAIYLSRCSGCTIENNIVTDNEVDGIFLKASSNCTIQGNEISAIERHGIHINYDSNPDIPHSANNEILHNTLKNIGFSFQYSGEAMRIVESSGNTISGNTIENNYYGIHMFSSTGNIISGNQFKDNSSWALDLATGYNKPPCTDNTIYNNLFDTDHPKATDAGTNTWNISKTDGVNIIGGPYLGGNYWYGYSGQDADSDGLGDSPYAISGIGNNIDNLPLVYVAVQSKPDLIITDIWNDNGTIRYRIKNIGNAKAPKGHHTHLYIDGIDQGFIDTPFQELDPNEEDERVFLDYVWSCGEPNDQVMVCADENAFVDESNATNNCLTEVWF